MIADASEACFDGLFRSSERSIHIAGIRNHTGQSSKGYAKLSELARMGYNPGVASWANRRGSEERSAAAHLLAKRRREIRLEW